MTRSLRGLRFGKQNGMDQTPEARSKIRLLQPWIVPTD